MARAARIPLGIVLPAAMVLVAALLWIYVWYATAGQMRAALGKWRAEMTAKGSTITCSAEASGGFPFRLSHECRDPVISVAVDGTVQVLSATRLVAVAQAYDPTHLIVELDAPVALQQGTAILRQTARAEDGAIRASIQLEDGLPTEISMVFPLFVANVGENPDGLESLTVDGGEFHLRFRPADDAIDVAFKSKMAQFSAAGSGAPIKIDRASLVAVVDHPPRVQLETASSWLEEWRTNNGAAEIKRLSFDSKTLGGDAAGKVKLAPSGDLEGALKARLTKLERLVDELKSRNVISDNEGQILNGAAGLFSQNIDGEKALTIPVRIQDGNIYLGPIKVATLPKLG